MNSDLILLGSTGTIGVQALEVAQKHGMTVRGLAAGKNVRRMEEQIRAFRPQIAAMENEQAAADLRARVADLPVRVVGGEDGVLEVASYEGDTVLNAIVGIAGCILLTLGYAALYVHFFAPTLGVNWIALLPIAACGSAISVVGDLSFSLIKRHYGIKDYGNIMPGHGGALDRFDSVIFVAPFFAVVTQYLPILHA